MPKCLVKSLVTRGGLCSVCSLRGREAGTPAVSYLMLILSYGKDQKPFFVAKVLSILGTKEIEAGFRFSLGDFPGWRLTFSVTSPQLPWEVLGMFFQTYDFSFSYMPPSLLLPIWLDAKKKKLTWPPNSEDPPKSQTIHMLPEADYNQQVNTGS